jgi:putative transposase
MEGALHHVYARGNRRQRVFVDERDRLTYLGLLGAVVREFEWRCLAYCLMGNHVHLLVETPRANLGVGIQRLHGVYGRRFNQRHDHRGHLFEGRYNSVLIRSDEQLWTVLRYIAMNPVEAGLCERPDQWRWSSWATSQQWLANARLMEFLGAAGGDPAARFHELASATLDPPQGV